MIEEQIESSMKAMAKSQEQLARTLRSEKRIARRMARVVSAVPPEKLPREFEPAYPDTAKAIARVISGYLGGLADLEDALADNLKFTIKELIISEEE